MEDTEEYGVSLRKAIAMGITDGESEMKAKGGKKPAKRRDKANKPKRRMTKRGC